MLKIILRTVLILVAAGLVCGGIYLFVQKGGVNLLAVGAQGERFGREARGGSFPQGDRGAAPGGDTGQRPTRLDGPGRDGSQGFSLAGLGGVGAQAGKVALITLVVVGIQFVFKSLKRKPASPAAA